MCSRRARTWWVGRGINGGSAELEDGTTVYLYSIEAFALAIVVPGITVRRLRIKKLGSIIVEARRLWSMYK
jgi:hypothetical protein